MTPATETADVGGARSAAAFDVAKVREDFPILHQQVCGHPLAYLDSANTSQKPRQVIEAVRHFYEHDNSNIHRGVHQLSIRATEAYEGARRKVQQFIGAERPEEIVFVRGATEGINLVAQTLGRQILQAGDEVVITHLEHHSNIVPWQMVCTERGAALRVVPIDDDGAVVMREFEKLVTRDTKIVAINHVSNALGTINPAEEMIAIAKARGAITVVDGAQSVPHMAVDVRALGADFFVLSGHKMFAPTGIGALYGRFDVLDKLSPYQGGGEMIKSVTFEKTIYNDLPHRFEAGTQNLAGAVGLGAAVDYLANVGMDNIAAYEHELLEYGTQKLQEVPGLRLIGTAPKKAAVLSFVLECAHPHDIGTILDQQGIAVRTGHHCAQPVMDRFGVPATVRASLAFYNTKEEIDRLAAGLLKVAEVFG